MVPKPQQGDNQENKKCAQKRIAVIGCGPSGMSMLITLVKAQRNGDQIPQIVCFEKQSEMGGQWVYEWRTGVDEFGTPVYNCMYEALRLNNAKEAQEFQVSVNVPAFIAKKG